MKRSHSKSFIRASSRSDAGSTGYCCVKTSPPRSVDRRVAFRLTPAAEQSTFSEAKSAGAAPDARRVVRWSSCPGAHARLAQRAMDRPSQPASSGLGVVVLRTSRWLCCGMALYTIQFTSSAVRVGACNTHSRSQPGRTANASASVEANVGEFSCQSNRGVVSSWHGISMPVAKVSATRGLEEQGRIAGCGEPVGGTEQSKPDRVEKRVSC